jgi:ribosomal protein L11 methyltransferase
VPRTWPVLILAFPADRDTAPLRDRALAALDDWQPTALSDEEPCWRVYFTEAATRDRAAAALTASLGPDGLGIATADEPDEDWGRRSQADLRAILVGRILVQPTSPDVPGPTPGVAERTPNPHSPIPIVIEPSMGFGTGHHATTRLCLAALQRLTLEGARVLDVGCGSGILAIAADRLGAAEVTGLDDDPDAVESACRNLQLNPAASHTTFARADIRAVPPVGATVVVANLTGAFLSRHADALLTHLVPGGTCILSGILAGEAQDVIDAFETLTLVERTQEDEWVGLTFRMKN